MKLIRNDKAPTATTFGELKPGECALNTPGATLWMRIKVGCKSTSLGVIDDNAVSKNGMVAIVAVAGQRVGDALICNGPCGRVIPAGKASVVIED